VQSSAGLPSAPAAALASAAAPAVASAARHPTSSRSHTSLASSREEKKPGSLQQHNQELRRNPCPAPAPTGEASAASIYRPGPRGAARTGAGHLAVHAPRVPSRRVGPRTGAPRMLAARTNQLRYGQSSFSLYTLSDTSTRTNFMRYRPNPCPKDPFSLNFYSTHIQ
jgi:hypothetical protein